MPLTPIDVQQKTFATALRGYNLDEVDDFLDEVVTSLKEYEERIRLAQERIAVLEEEATRRGDSESAISRALVAAQRSADRIVEDARSEGEAILARARLEAEALAEDFDEEQDRLREEIEGLRTTIGELRSRIRELAESVWEDLDTMAAVVDEAATRIPDRKYGDKQPDGSERTSHEEASDEVRADTAGPEGAASIEHTRVVESAEEPVHLDLLEPIEQDGVKAAASSSGRAEEIDESSESPTEESPSPRPWEID